jgi:hypothetical protein
MSNPQALAAARARDSDVRRQRVLHVLAQAAGHKSELSVSAVARAARVHRSFIHRHPELRAAVAAAQLAPAASSLFAVSEVSLRAEVANLKAQNLRLLGQLAKLETRLSELMGEQVYRTNGIGAPDETASLREHVTELDQRLLDLQRELEDRTDSLNAARVANRELMAELNRGR